MIISHLSKNWSVYCKHLLPIAVVLFLTHGVLVKGQNTNSQNINAGNVNSNGNTTANVSTNTNSGASKNTNNAAGLGSDDKKNQEGSGSASSTANTAGETRRDELSKSWWFIASVTAMFGAILIPFGMTIVRAIRFSKSTFNSPLGLPEGSLRAMLAYMLVTFLGLYVYASILSLTDVKLPDALLGIVATVIGFYFGSRSGETASSSIPKTTGSVEGTVLDQNNSPAMGAQVDLLQSGVKKFTQTADQNGKYRLDNVPIGNYDILASRSDHTPSAPAKVNVTAGSTQTANLKLQ